MDSNHPDIPNYEILGRIGGGGYGEVFLARTVTGALRAVKIVRREDFEMDKTFEREFEGIQRYEQVSQDHEGLVNVLHVGREEDAGFYYYVMDLADAELGDPGEEIDPETYRPRTLSSDLRQNPLRPIEECTSLGIAISEALGHLHQAGLTHRDVKPSNIIFVKGKPQLADVGLVARDGQRTYVGTEGYVPPEGPGTTSADLYSLAMVLYEMHTGKDRLDFPELPTNMELPPTVNRDEWRSMNTVICRAGSPDPRKRYETAHIFSAALRKIAGEPDPTRPIPPVRSSSAFSKFTAMATLLMLAIIGVGGYWLWKDREMFTGLNPGAADPTSPGEIDGTPDEPGQPSDFSIIEKPPEGVTGEVVFQDKPSEPPPPEKEPEPKETPEAKPPEKPKIVAVPTTMAEVKIFSTPSGATVYSGNEEIGRTPTNFLAFPPGVVELTIRNPGHLDFPIVQNLEPGRNPSVQAELKIDFRPVPGAQTWQNSLGMSFRENPVSGQYVADQPVSVSLFETYTKETGASVPAVAIGNQIQIEDEQAVWDFCDWMTAKDREFGYLDQYLYLAPQREKSPTQKDAFRCVVAREFGTVLLNSEPKGAEIISGGRVIGTTPFTLSPFRHGPFSLELRLPGYQPEFATGKVEDSTPLPITIPMKRDSSLVFGEAWENSQGMKLVPVANLMVATTETTVQNYQHFLGEKPEGIFPPQPGFPQEYNHPVCAVTLEEAKAFCKWLTSREHALQLVPTRFEYRLPTDREWSSIAGLPAEDGTTPESRDSLIPAVYPWGLDWPPPADTGNFADSSATGELGKYLLEDYFDGHSYTAPAGSFSPNKSGLFDLSGNVWEWVDDRYDGSGSGLGVVRGGGWNSYQAEQLLTSYRNAVSVSRREGLYGFRYVLAPKAD